MRLRHATFPAAALALIAIGTTLASACGGDEAAAADVLRSDVARAPADAEAMPGAASALSVFSADLYAVLGEAEADANLVFSPYSAAIALAMTRAGAAGETLEQMNTVLHAEMGDLDMGLNAIDQALAGRTGEYDWHDETVELELSTANQLWGQQDFAFHDGFLDSLAASYGAGLRLVDFDGDHPGARKLINEWDSEQTRERIPELIPEGVLNEMTRLVLTNAIYLKAPWAHRFEPEATAPGPFTLLDGTSVEADFMRLGERLRYATGDGYQAVELPYVDGSLAMVVVLPDDGEFASFEENLDGGTLDGITGGLETAQVNLVMPKFEFRTQAGLKDALSEMGMPIAFDEADADFSGMSPEGADMYLQDVIHEAFISVNEEGTEAAAATAVVAGVASSPSTIVDLAIDRPFVFFIHDQETGAILFMGRVTNPTR